MSNAEPPPVPWLVDGLVARGRVTLLTGEPGEGKSLLALIMAMCVAQGTPFANRDTVQGSALIVDAENGEDEIHRRVRFLGMSGHGLFVLEARGFDLSETFEDLARSIERYEPDLVVLDSFRSLWPTGNENDSGDVSRVLGRVRSLLRDADAAGLLLHHKSKPQGQWGSSGSPYRGGTAIKAVPDFAFELRRIRRKDKAGAARWALRCFKSRSAVAGEDLWARLDESGRLEACDATPTGRTSARRDELIELALAALAPDHRLGVTELATRMGVKPDNRTLRVALQHAQDVGLLTRDDDRRYRLTGESSVATTTSGDDTTTEGEGQAASEERS